MDNTFENGFMCGLLMNSVHNKYIEPKEDAMFDFILQHIIPVMSIKITENYKTVRGIIDLSDKRANFGGLKWGSYYSTYCKIDDIPLTSGYGTFMPQPYSVNICAAIILYKNDKPQWARITNDYFTKTDSYTYRPLYNLPYYTEETQNEYRDMKEIVFWKTKAYKFLPETVQYLGDYKIIPPTFDSSNGYGGYKLCNSLKFQDETGNAMSSAPKCTFEIEQTNYKAEDVQIREPYPNDDGTYDMINDNRYPPKLIIDTIATVSSTIEIGSSYVDYLTVVQPDTIDGRTYTDLSNEALINLDFDVMTDIVKEIGDQRYTKVISGRLLN